MCGRRSRSSELLARASEWVRRRRGAGGGGAKEREKSWSRRYHGLACGHRVRRGARVIHCGIASKGGSFPSRTMAERPLEGAGRRVQLTLAWLVTYSIQKGACILTIRNLYLSRAWFLASTEARFADYVRRASRLDSCKVHHSARDGWRSSTKARVDSALISVRVGLGGGGRAEDVSSVSSSGAISVNTSPFLSHLSLSWFHSTFLSLFSFRLSSSLKSDDLYPRVHIHPHPLRAP